MTRIALLRPVVCALISSFALGAVTPAAAQDSGAQVTLLPDLLSLTLLPGDVVLRTEATAQGIDLRLTNEQGQILRIMAGTPDRSTLRQLRRFFDRIDSVSEGSMAGQPAWLVRGITDRSPIGGRDGTETAALVVVPQVCDATGSPFAVALLSEPGVEGAAEALLPSLVLSLPEGGGACAEMPDIALLTAPAAPEPTTAPAMPDEVAPEHLALLGDQVMLTLPEGAVVGLADLAPDAADVQVTLADGAQVRVLAMVPALPILDQVGGMLHRVDSIGSAQMGGMMFATAEGPSRASATGEPVAEGDGVPSRILVPQVCVAGEPPFVVQLTSGPGLASAIETLLPGLGAAAPEGAVACPDVLFGLPVGIAPAADSADDWVAQERFGIRFALPAEVHVRLDRANDGSAEYWAQVIDAEGNPASEFSLFVMDSAALASKLADEGVVADRLGFETMLSRFANAPMQRTDESLMLDDVSLSFYRNTGPRRMGEEQVAARILFLIAESPAPSGLSPWAVVVSNAQDEESARAFEDRVLASLGGAAIAPPPQATPASDADGKLPPAMTTAEPVMPQTSHPLPDVPPLPGGDELADWSAAISSGRHEDLWTYLKAYPQGQFVELARVILAGNTMPQPSVPLPVPDVANK